MRVSIGLLLVLAISVAIPARASEPPAPEEVVRLLGHEDPIVRREAARTLLRLGFGAEAAARNADFVPAKNAGWRQTMRAERLRVEAAKVSYAFLLARRLAEADTKTAAFWIALDDAITYAPSELRDDVLRLGVGDVERRRSVLKARAAAADAVAAFVRDWNEMYTEGSEEQRRYEVLRESLLSRGMAAVPPLLRILEVDPRRAFLYLDPPPEGEVSARMQVRAIFGLSFLEPPEAIPYLVVHARSPSLTAASNASAVLMGLAGIQGAGTGLLVPLDLAVIDAWWAEHRHEFMAPRRGLERALVDALRISLAHETIGVAKARDTGQIVIPMPHELVSLGARQAWLVELLCTLTGDGELAYDRDAPVWKRLAQVRRIAVRVERARAE